MKASDPQPFPASFFNKFPACEDFEAKVPIVRVASGRVIHRFFDTSPISPSGRYLALFKMPTENQSPLPGQTGEVVLVDLFTGTERSIDSTRGWETQLGANVQWGSSDDKLYYNDVEISTWTPFAVEYNVLTGEKRKLGGTVFTVSPDGTKLASYNLASSRRIQKGYGVVVPDNVTPKNQGPVKNDGIYITDVATGESRLVASIRDILENAKPRIEIANPENYEFYGFQVRWNPAGTRLMVFLRWTSGDENGKPAVKQLALVTLRPDGTDITVAVDAERYAKGGHHPMWTPDSEQLIINLNLRDDGSHLDLAEVRYDGRNLRSIYPTGSGHPSMHPRLPFVITDAYPMEKISRGDGTAPLRLIDLEKQTETILAQVKLTPKGPEKLDSEFRIDAHPAWDRTGRFVIFNGVHENSRAVFIADLGAILSE